MEELFFWDSCSSVWLKVTKKNTFLYSYFYILVWGLLLCMSFEGFLFSCHWMNTVHKVPVKSIHPYWKCRCFIVLLNCVKGDLMWLFFTLINNEKGTLISKFKKNISTKWNWEKYTNVKYLFACLAGHCTVFYILTFRDIT